MKVLLNSDKIRKEADRVGLKLVDLADKMGISRQLLHYSLEKKSLKHLDVFAKVLNLDPRDLLIYKKAA